MKKKHKYYERAVKLTHKNFPVNSENILPLPLSQITREEKMPKMFKITISSQYTCSFPVFRRK